jgi:hypothetical protein
LQDRFGNFIAGTQIGFLLGSIGKARKMPGKCCLRVVIARRFHGLDDCQRSPFVNPTVGLSYFCLTNLAAETHLPMKRLIFACLTSVVLFAC